MKTLGIVGGLGPDSTIEYYRRLIEGYRERFPDGSYPSLLIHSIDVNKMLTLTAAADRGLLIEYLLASLRTLSLAGADFALLAANTPHIVFSELATKSPLPLVSIVEATCAFSKARKFKKVGLFGTRFTMQAGFYQQVFTERHIEIVIPCREDQDYIHEKYVGELVVGRFLNETRSGMRAIAERLREESGIEALILGGTELPLLFRDHEQIRIPLLDTTQIHVQAALDQM